MANCIRLLVTVAVTLTFVGILLEPKLANASDCRAQPSPNVDWQDCRKRNIILSGADLSNAMLGETDFTSTDLREANLNAADLTKSTLVRATLDNAKAQDSKFEKAHGFRSSFVGADLQNANFTKSEMQRAVFSEANLTNANFSKAELGRVNFSGAKITGIDFAFANLARTDLRDAVFKGAIDFTKARLFLTRIEGVDLSNATGLVQWQIDMSCGDKMTKLPQSLSPSPNWPCEES